MKGKGDLEGFIPENSLHDTAIQCLLHGYKLPMLICIKCVGELKREMWSPTLGIV